MSEKGIVKRELPSIEELYRVSDLEQISNQSKLAFILNQPPNEKWVKQHDITKLSYIPIGIVEYLLTRIFLEWRVEVKDVKLVANSVLVTVRLHYKDPITREWSWQDGIGAQPLQTDKGAGATDFNKIKSAAVAMAAPSAESYAVKDAAEKLGKIFGKDLNRKDEMNYAAMLAKAEKADSTLEKILSDD